MINDLIIFIQIIRDVENPLMESLRNRKQFIEDLYFSQLVFQLASYLLLLASKSNFKSATNYDWDKKQKPKASMRVRVINRASNNGRT